jgi:hypothetical protein
MEFRLIRKLSLRAVAGRLRAVDILGFRAMGAWALVIEVPEKSRFHQLPLNRHFEKLRFLPQGRPNFDETPYLARLARCV